MIAHGGYYWINKINLQTFKNLKKNEITINIRRAFNTNQNL